MRVREVQDAQDIQGRRSALGTRAPGALDDRVEHRGRGLRFARPRPGAWTGDSPQGAEYLKLYEADLDRTRVAYSGTTNLGDRGDYVRLDGPRVWIEFATQGSDHVHTIWRDRLTDYGAEFSF